jgi:hypothetical protein
MYFTIYYCGIETRLIVQISILKTNAYSLFQGAPSIDVVLKPVSFTGNQNLLMCVYMKKENKE